MDLVKKEGLIGKTDSSSGAGTDAGGQIEVYTSESDAKRRNDYLSGFDGTWISPGGHKVVGTCVVRTTNKLTATQQKELEALIIEALTKLK